MMLDFPAAPHIEVSGEARLAHDGWVSEFESFQWSDEKENGRPSDAGAVPASARSAGRSNVERGRSTLSAANSSDPTNTMDNLRAEIKLLHWHKLANEAALKAALLKTKKIKARGGGTSRPVPATTTLSMPTEERAAWMQQVIEEEQSKPLQVSKDFMCKYEEQEMETEGRLDKEVAAHIRSLRNLRKQIEERGEMKARRVKYREAQKQLELEKQQLLLGKLHGNESSGPASACTNPRDGGGIIGAGAGGKAAGSGQRDHKTVGALDTVLGSLDKLVELEKRISSLEKNNVYDDFRAKKQRGAGAGAGAVAEGESRSVGRKRNSSRAASGVVSSRRSNAGRPSVGSRNRRRLSFSKQTTEATINAPSKTYYSVRVRQKPRSTAGNSTTLKRRSGGSVASNSVVRQSAPARKGSSRARGGASTFLTQLPDVHRHQRAGNQGGGGGFRSAIGEKKRIEARRRLAGDRAEANRIARQDRIIREWMQRKRAAAAPGSGQRKPSRVFRSGGAPAVEGQRRRSEGVEGGSTNRRGVKHMHLQEFRDIRAHYAKRSERLRRDLSRRQNGPDRGVGMMLPGTRTVSVARPRAALVVRLAPSRPGRVAARMDPGLPRGRGGPTFSAGMTARGQTGKSESRRGSTRRTEQGALRLGVGGTGFRAARARREESAMSQGCDDTGRRRRETARLHRTVLPTVRGVGPRSGKGSSGRGRGRGAPTVEIESW